MFDQVLPLAAWIVVDWRDALLYAILLVLGSFTLCLISFVGYCFEHMP
jgi:hypothetical protein